MTNIPPACALASRPQITDRQVKYLNRAIFRYILFVILSLAASVCAASQQEELNNLRRRIVDMQNEISKTSETKTAAADALYASERAISDIKRKIFQLTEQQSAANIKFNALQGQQQNINDSISRHKDLLGKLLYQEYLSGEHEYIKLMLDSRDPNQIARDIQYYQYIARDRAALLGNLRGELKEIDRVRTEAHTQSVMLQQLRAEKIAQQEQFKQKQLEKQVVLAQMSRQLSSQRQEVGRLQHDESRLTNLVAKIARMLAKPKSKSLFHNDNLPDNRFDGKPFEQLQGKLVLPVKGEIANKFGTTRPDSTVLWQGLFIKSGSGQSVKAVAAGRVVFADWLRGFGNLLIVDHGKAYMSLYGDNETLLKQVGDEVRGGDIIATTGNSGGNNESGLYFELRHESRPLDPLKWMATK